MTPVQPGCPRCGATARPGSQWCTLCYTDLRPAPVPTRAPEPALVSVPDDPAAETSGTIGPAATTPRGKHARSDSRVEDAAPANPVAEVSRAAEGGQTLGTEAMLALLAAESAKPLGGLAGRIDSNSARIGLIAGGIVVFSAVMFLLMVIIGSMI